LDEVTALSDRPSPIPSLSASVESASGPTHGRRTQPVEAAPLRAPSSDAPYVSVGPICGRPHPKSYVEQRVYQSIQADQMLAPLFEYNQRLLPESAKTCIVDLVWRQGRLVVELDGDEHFNRQNYVSDRDRDYRLTLHGYTVLRITNVEVFVDVELALIKIRNIVALIQKRLAHEGNTRI